MLSGTHVRLRLAVLQVEEVAAGRVHQRVEEPKHGSCDICTKADVVAPGNPHGQLNDDADSVQHGQNARIDQLREDPLYGDLRQGLPDGQEVDEDQTMVERKLMTTAKRKNPVPGK